MDKRRYFQMIVHVCIIFITMPNGGPGEDVARRDPVRAHRHRPQCCRPRTKGWRPVQVCTLKFSYLLEEQPTLWNSGANYQFLSEWGCVSWEMSGGLVGSMSKVFKCQISNLNRLLGLVSTGIKTKLASSHLNETVERCCWCFLQESLRQALPSARPKVLNVQFFFPLISLLFLHSMQ